jgi:hypothetical protein
MLLMQQARKLDSLTEEQAQQIDALMSEFSGAVDEANMRLLAVVRDDEPKAPRRRLKAAAERRAAGGAGSPGTRPDDPVATARAERDRMGEPYRARLMAILTPEQQSELPGGPRPDPKQGSPLEAMQEDGNKKIDEAAPGADDKSSRASGSRRDLRDRSGKGDFRKAGEDTKQGGGAKQPAGTP